MRILLADKRKEVRSALRLALEVRCPQWTFLEAGTLAEMIACLSLGCPDLVILDWDLRGLPGQGAGFSSHQQAIRKLHQACPRVKLLVVGSSPEFHQDALLAGADGYVCKADPPESLEITIRSILE